MKEGQNYLPKGLHRTLDACDFPSNFEQVCRPRLVGGAKNRIYLCKKSEIVSVTKNADDAIEDFTFLSTPAFIYADCRPNSVTTGYTGNGADGAGSKNATYVVTFAVEGWSQNVINWWKQIEGQAVCIIYGSGNQDANGEDRYFVVGYSGDGLDIGNTTALGLGAAKTDPVGATIEFSGTLAEDPAELIPLTNKVTYLNSLLATP